MAYNPKNLSVLAYANGFTLWHYRTQHDAASLRPVGYFDQAADMLRAGDMILVNANGWNGVVSIKSNSSGRVDAECLTKMPDDDVETEQGLKSLMRDPRYWKYQDPEIVAKVREGFRRIYSDRA